MLKEAFIERCYNQSGFCHNPNHRHFSCVIVGLCLGRCFGTFVAMKAVSPSGLLRERYGHMVHEYYVARLRAIMDARRARIDALRTRKDAEKYVRSVRAKVRRVFSPLPPRTPLNAKVTGADSCGRFTIEKVVFQSRPGFFVTGNLYIPEGAGPHNRHPAALVLCGHSPAGKSYSPYQQVCQGLVSKGFMVLIIDPVSQGERRQYYPDDGLPLPDLCHSHNLMGNQMVLLDGFLGTWRVWDAIRALDYLLSRPEVDRRCVGVTGNSGGGTLATYLAALDPRITMVAPSCFICSYLANLENELPSDAEQNPPDILAFGLDEADLLLCQAPRPTLILSQFDDFFDERYARQAADEVRKIHKLLGAGDAVSYFAGPQGHGFSQENREAVYAFFMRQAGMAGNQTEGPFTELATRRLNVLPEGQVRALDSRRIFEITAEAARDLARKRGRPSTSQVTRVARRLLGLPEFKQPPFYRVLRPDGGGVDGLSCAAQFAVETEPGIQAIATIYGAGQRSMHPPQGNLRLYVGHLSGNDDVRQIQWVRTLAQGKTPFVALDPRGIGEGVSKSCGSRLFLEPYGNDYLYAATGEMLGESYLGRRVWDVVRGLDFLYSQGAGDIRLIGRGLGSVVVVFAALLHPRKPRVEIYDYLPSFEWIIKSPQYSWPLSSLLRGSLKHFDLPDVYRVLGARLTKRQPWGARMRPDKSKT